MNLIVDRMATMNEKKSFFSTFLLSHKSS